MHSPKVIIDRVASIRDTPGVAGAGQYSYLTETENWLLE
jgi:hypothetical protein